MKRDKFNFENLTSGFKSHTFQQARAIHADCFEWLSSIPESCIHAIVTDPPYGLKEYYVDQLEKRAAGKGGMWRIPPAFDGHKRSPLPRFTALDAKERSRLHAFFTEWSKLASRVLKPGGHIFIATNAFIAPLLYNAILEGGLEFRGQIIRLVRTLRGGDRPKNAENEFSDVCSLPRGCYEPWGLFRKPLPSKMTVGECLRKYQTGGLRRLRDSNPFCDMIPSERTSKQERDIASHPSLKPQSFLRQLVYSALPLGVGIVADPFMGSGSTIAAAEYLGANSVGIEYYEEYYKLACKAIPKLANYKKNCGVLKLHYNDCSSDEMFSEI